VTFEQSLVVFKKEHFQGDVISPVSNY